MNFETEDQDDSSFFHETFSQLRKCTNQVSFDDSIEISDEKGHSRPTARSRSSNREEDKLEEFEEAFTVLKSIQRAHEPVSFTSINALLHTLRGLNTNKRTLKGLVWPEHPETFSSSRLIEISVASGSLNEDGLTEYKEISQFYTETDEDQVLEEDEEREAGITEEEGLCEMSQSKVLHKALIRTCQSIWREKTFNSPSEIDKHLSHVISRRCSFLLQTIFKRALLNRRSALKVLSSFPECSRKDLDNVPVNWEDVREASRQIIGQAAWDMESFLKFKIRLEKGFRKKRFSLN